MCTLIAHTLLGLGFIAITWRHALSQILKQLRAEPYSWHWLATASLTTLLLVFAMSLLYALASGLTEAIFDHWAAKSIERRPRHSVTIGATKDGMK